VCIPLGQDKEIKDYCSRIDKATAGALSQTAAACKQAYRV